MGLADYTPVETNSHGPVCSVTLLLTDEDRATIRQWLNQGHGYTAIARSLNEYGVNIKALTLRRHYGTPKNPPQCSCDDATR